MKKKVFIFILIFICSFCLISCDKLIIKTSSEGQESTRPSLSDSKTIEPITSNSIEPSRESTSETSNIIEPSQNSTTSTTNNVEPSHQTTTTTEITSSSEDVPQQPVIEYRTVTFYTRGGTNITDIKVEKGKKITIPNIIKEGFTLEGWYLDSNYQNYFDVNSPINENIKLYAYWQQDANKYIYLDNYLNNGRVIRLPHTSWGGIGFEEIKGYSLEGLYTSSDYSKRATSSDFSINCTLYCKWKKNNTYKELEESVDIKPFIDKLISDTVNSNTPYVPAWNKESFKDKWNYIDGVFLRSIVNLYYDTNDEKYKNFVHDYVNYYINSNGEFVIASTQSTDGAFKDTELDTICESFILFDLAKWYSDDDRYEKAIEYTYDKLIHMNTCDAYGSPNYWHKTSYPYQIWLDGMYMYGPFMARYAKEKNVDSLFDLLKSQYEYIFENMSSEFHLLVHGLDTSQNIFWNNENGKSSNVWLRSLGWYVCSLVDVIEYYPEGDNKEYLKGVLVYISSMLHGRIDQESKMLYQLPELGNHAYCVGEIYLDCLNNEKYKVDGNYKSVYISNYLESSGSSMVSYALLKASRLGYIDPEFSISGKEVFEGTYENSFDKDNNVLKDICITAGLGPSNKMYRDGSISYYLSEPVGENDAKGVGPFIMAYLEYSKLSD